MYGGLLAAPSTVHDWAAPRFSQGSAADALIRNLDWVCEAGIKHWSSCRQDPADFVLGGRLGPLVTGAAGDDDTQEPNPLLHR